MPKVVEVIEIDDSSGSRKSKSSKTTKTSSTSSEDDDIVELTTPLSLLSVTKIVRYKAVLKFMYWMFENKRPIFNQLYKNIVSKKKNLKPHELLHSVKIQKSKVNKQLSFNINKENSFYRLRNKEMYNDEIINSYLFLINQAYNTNNKYYIFNTYFYTNIESSKSRWNNWMKNDDIFKKDKLFVPVHDEDETHWYLVVVDFTCKKIEIIDSMIKQVYKDGANIFTYLMNENKNHYEGKYNDLLRRTQWKFEVNQNVKQQTNIYDCGVFLCKNVEHIIVGEPFISKNIKIAREQIAVALGLVKK